MGTLRQLKKFFIVLALCLSSYLAHAQETVLDQFGTAAYTNNNGTRNWATNWTEAGDGSTGAGSGLVQITGGALRLGSSGSATGTTVNIQRSVDLSGVNSATLTFSIAQTGIDTSGDSVVIEVSGDGGTTYITPVLDEFRTTGLGNETYTLPVASLSATTAIRFRVAEGLESGEYFTVDNVQISFTSNAPGYKSVALTKDGDGGGTITTGDTLTYTVQYKNISSSSITNFQITDTLPTNVTLAATPTVTGATVNAAYTGVSPNNTLLTALTLTANSVVTVSIPVVVNAAYTGTLSNQASATATNFVASSSDNVDNTTAGLPTGITVPSGSIAQTQTTAISPTTATVVAASAGAAFTCDAAFYQTRIIGATGSQFSRVFRIDRSVIPYTQTAVGTPPNIVINGMGYNVLDNYMYAIYLGPEGSTTNGTTSSLGLYRIGQGGFQSLGPITGLPTGFQPTAADFDGSNNFYVTRAAGSNELYRINVTTRVATLITMTATPNLADMSFNPIDNFLYAVNNSPQELYKINPTTGAWTTISITGVTSGEGAWGTTFFDKAGTFYAYGNEGSFYTINLTTGAATRLSSADSALRSDGASCVFPPPTVDVVKSVGTPVAVNTTTADIPYTVVVGNRGTTSANNVQVTENLGLTFSSGSPTITISAGPTVTAGTCTANNSATGLPQFDGVDNGNAGELALLEGTNSLAAGASCTITFTARVAYPSVAAIPTTAQNNSVYASSSSITNRGHTFPTTGVILPPPNLLAFDTSTNVTNPATFSSLPATSNADTASVTPVTFQDYGDAPTSLTSIDASLTAIYQAASHPTGGAYLGSSIDVELANQPNVTATGDDSAGTDDENGVTFPTPALLSGQSNSLTVTASASGFLNAWIDWNQDGDWADTGEQIANNQTLSAGSNSLSVTPVTTCPHGATYARFRFTGSSASGLSPTGSSALTGEVEDYQISIALPTPPPGTCNIGLLDDGFEIPDITGSSPTPYNVFTSLIKAYKEVDVEGWGTVANDPTSGASFDERNAIELWRETSPPPYEGNQYAEINAYVAGTLYQDVVTTPGAVLTWQFAHRGRSGTDTVEVVIGSPASVVSQGQFSTDNTAWRVYRGAYTVPAGQTITRFGFKAVSTASSISVGNFIDDVRFGVNCDYGDAPNSYGNAQHVLDARYLGARVDADDGRWHNGTDNATNASDDDTNDGAVASGSANDDEDGVLLDGLDLQGQTLVGGTTAVLTITTAGSGVLNAWIDWNRDGDFADVGEQVATNAAPVSNLVTLNVSVPSTLIAGTSYARFRFGSSGVTNTGGTTGGEVEDYRMTLSENAKPGIAKALDRIVHSNNATDNTYTLVYRLTVENFGTFTLSNLAIYDDVVTQFSGLSPTNFNTWVNANSASLSPAPTLTLNGSWNGTSSSNILSTSPVQTLTAGQSKLVYISFNVTVNPVATTPDNRLRDNSATVQGTTPSSITLSDTSTNGTDPDGTDNDNNPDENTATPTPFVKLVKEVRNCGSSLSSCTGTYAVTATGKPGDYLEYRIRYYNISSRAISQLRVADSLASATPFQEDTYAVISPNVADFNVTCPSSSTVDLDRTNAAITTTPAVGAVTAFNINIMAATVCNLTQVTVGQQGQVLFKVRIP